MNCQEIVDYLKKSEKWHIYGAGIIAYNVSLALEECFNLHSDSFLVTRPEDCSSPFIEADQISPLGEQALDSLRQTAILVATPTVYHEEIEALFHEMKIQKYLLLTDNLYYEIMAAYHRKLGEFSVIEDLLGNAFDTKNHESLDIGVYMAKSHVDAKLKQEYTVPDYVKPIQAGAQLTDKRIALFQDNTGINISSKNNRYSELTATYWVWKNTEHTYKGVCHYRRMLVLSQSDLELLRQREIDAVLPLPYICRHSADEQYARYVRPEDFTGMMRALKDIDETMHKAAVRIFSDRYLYNYNMLIAKQEIFDSYCAWLFPILERAEYYCEADGKRTDRYMGYLGELLTSLYFLVNRENMKIAHAQWIWMV